ncbi:MAG: hypothetical protein Q9166_004919 [cf. Caloplaca sp. 2 TL-2023]
MDDARLNDSLPPQNNNQSPEPVAMTSPTATTFKQEVSEYAQALLQRMAQDASSQPDDASHRQDKEPTQRTIDDHALVNGHALPLPNGVHGQAVDRIGNLDESPILSEGAEAQAVDLSCERSSEPALPNGQSNLTQANIAALTDDPTWEATTSVIDGKSEAPRIEAFAKLEFDDGEFYMNTYSIELGRDVHAARQAYERDIQIIQRASGSSHKRSSSSGDISGSSSKKVKRENGRHPTGSIVSESGGVMGVDHPDAEAPRRRRDNKSKSTTSSSQQLSRKSSMNFPGTRTDYQSLALASLSDPLPSPESCPLVPIHPPTFNDGIPTSHKSISRKHVKIAFNFEKHLFELTVMGRNGAFVDEEWYPEGDTQELRSGSLIQIGGVGIRFLLPDVALGETGAESNPNSDPASFELENETGAHGDMEDIRHAERDEQDEDEDESRDDSNDDESIDSSEGNQSENISEEETRGRPREPKPTLANRPVRNRKPVHGKEPTNTKDPPKAKGKRPEKVKLKLKAKKEPTPEPIAPPPKRKGPGRPPKNGIISKRAEALLAKEARERAKAAANGEPDTKPGRGKGKSIPNPTNVKQEESNLQPTGKRKYKKRKSKAETEGDQQNVRESTEHTESMPPEQNAAPAPPPKPPKPVKPPKPPRSPSPVFDEATLTPEQLAKPQSSYVVLIHEALSNSKTQQMSLPQIYRAIERKYPFYKLRVQTNGWQSSVRHNLSQHPAFCKIERDGKGWMWGLVPEVSIEKEKKRRMTPPPMLGQGYYPTAQMLQPAYPYPMPYPPYATYPGMSMGQRPPYPPPPHFAPQPAASSLPPALANAQVDTSSTYQSPYAAGPSQQTAESSHPPQQAPTTDGQQPNPAAAPSTSQATSTPTPRDQAPPAVNPNPPNPVPGPSPSSSALHLPQPPSIQQLLSQQTPEITHHVQKFKSHLLSEMSDNPHAESLVDCAIARVLDPGSSGPQDTGGVMEDSHQEKAIMRILRDMLDNVRKKHVGGGESGGAGGDGSGGGSGGGGGGGGGEGRRDTSFFQILEKVSERHDGGLPLPDTQHHPPRPTRSPSGPPAETVNVDTGAEEVGEVKGEGVMVNGVVEKDIQKVAEVTPRDEPRSLKRSLSDDAENAMDSGPREAKRVAT